MNPTSHDFLKLGNVYTKSSLTKSTSIALRRFKSFFGVSPTVCCLVWQDLANELPPGALPKHLLWCLSFMKSYSIEHYRRSIFNADEKTIRMWTWTFVKLLSDLNVVIWENRFEGALHDQICFVSLDGVDFKILEPSPFSKGWFSHKFKSAALRYEIGLNIHTGNIVWSFGGYPCGLFPDLKLAREAYVHSVRRGEKIMADEGYKDKTYFILPNDQNGAMHKMIMSRHQIVNKRLRQFCILKKEFRNDLRKHAMVFHAVINLTQMVIQTEEPLFSVPI